MTYRVRAPDRPRVLSDSSKGLPPGGAILRGKTTGPFFGQRLNDRTRSPTLWPYYHTVCESRLDPGPVGFSRSHGCSRGDPSNGATPLLDLFFRDSLRVSGRLLPRSSTFSVLVPHKGRGPHFPTLAGQTLNKEGRRLPGAGPPQNGRGASRSQGPRE